MVDVWLPYGNTEVCLRVPTKSFLGTIKPNDREGPESPQLEIGRSLEEPMGTNRLLDLVKPGDRISIVINGADDPSFNVIILKPMVKKLNEAGVKNRNIKVIKGYDPLHTNTTESKIHLQGDEALEEVKVISHNPEAEENVYVGETSFGTKVYLNRAFAEAEIKILAGFLEPHPYTGYSGARDGVLPGVSSIQTVQHNLSMVTDPKASPGLIAGNPVHQDMVEAARLVGVDFTLNVVRNGKQEIVKAFAGDLEKAFERGVDFADEIYKIPIRSRCEIVFLSPGGLPFDANLYESCRGIKNALEATKKKAVTVLVAECSKGYGDKTFHEWMTRFDDLKGMEKHLKKHFMAGGYFAYSLMRALERSEVMLVSALPDYYAFEVFKLRSARTVNEALRYAFDIAGKNAKVLAISQGNLTIPVVR